MATIRWRLGRFAGAATLFVLCVALAVAPATLDDEEEEAPRTLADACEDLSSGRFDATLKCGSTEPHRESGFLCKLIKTREDVTSLLLAATDPEGVDLDIFTHGLVCALKKDKKILAEVCEASQDALAASPANLTSLCKQAFEKLPSMPPPSPRVLDFPCQGIYQHCIDKCSELFSNGEHVYKVRNPEGTRVNPATGTIYMGAVTTKVDCCDLLDTQCRCKVKEDLAKAGKVSNVACLKNLNSCS